jgi:hypothetical protein
MFLESVQICSITNRKIYEWEASAGSPHSSHSKDLCRETYDRNVDRINSI